MTFKPGHTTEWQRRNRARGRCGCGRKPKVDGGAICAVCSVAKAADNRARYWRRRNAGQCVFCTSPSESSSCADCKGFERAKYVYKRCRRKRAA